MKKILTGFGITLLILGMLVTKSFGQGVMQFNEDVHTFDAIIEGEQATHEFRFTNTGDKPIVISHVQPACGCTTPSWTKDPVLPGKQGVITATYNSTGRPGPFNKTISVTSNAKISSLMLAFRGVVLPKPKGDFKPEELASSPKIVLDKQQVTLGKVQAESKALAKFKVTNQGKAALNITEVQSSCICTSFKMSKPTIAPGETADLEITFTGKNLGSVDEKVYIMSNDLANPYTKVFLKVDVVKELVKQSIMKEGGSGFKF